MAIYKSDIIDINLNTGNIHRSFLNHTIGQKDDDADRFGIRAFRDGVPVDLSGVSCHAWFTNSQGTTLALTSYGTVSGNEAYVTLPQACYDYDGQFCLAIKLVGGGVSGTVRIVDGVVDNINVGGAVSPTSDIPDYSEILDQYAAMVSATSAANLAIAETFDATKAYPAGKYVINSGALYRLTADHAANVTWANTSKVATNLGDETTSLKSAINAVMLSSGYITTNTDPVVPTVNPSSTGYRYAVIDCEEGEQFFITGTGASGARLWCFVDSSYGQLSVSAANKTETGKLLVAPANASKLIVNDNSGTGYVERKNNMENYILDIAKNALALRNDQCKVVPDGTDLNSLIPGNYRVENATHAATMVNGPATNAGYRLIVMNGSGPNPLINIAVLNTTTNQVLIRYYHYGTTTWTVWNKFAFKEDVDAEIDGSIKQATKGQVLYQWIEGSYIAQDGTETVDSNFHHSDFIKIDKTYPMYICYAGFTGTGSETYVRIHAYDKNKQWIRQVASSTFTDTTSKRYFTARFRNDEEYFILSCSKIKITVFSLENLFIKNNLTNLIEDAYIRNMKGVFATPTVNTVSDLQENTALTAKPSVFKNGDYYCCIFQENLDGSADDVPRTSGTGVIALRYKKFKITNGVESEVSYGTIAKKGSSYTDYNGNAATFEGGVGKPCGNNGIQFCTAAANGDYVYNGIANYGMTPCAFTVTVGNDGSVTFGSIRELTLDIGGTVGKFDVRRLDDYYIDYFVYYTLSVPVYDGSKWHWLVPVVNGIAYFTSDDGFAWEYVNTVETPFQIYADVTCENVNSDYLIFAARLNGNTPLSPSFGDCTIIGILNKSGYIYRMYKMPGKSARSYIAKISETQYLLFTNLSDVKNATCISMVYDNEKIFFYEWFNIYNRCCWYTYCYKTGISSSYTQLILAGTDGQPTATRKSTFMILDVPSTPRSVSNVPFGVE